jgi:hypothetical protein
MRAAGRTHVRDWGCLGRTQLVSSRRSQRRRHPTARRFAMNTIKKNARMLPFRPYPVDEGPQFVERLAFVDSTEIELEVSPEVLQALWGGSPGSLRTTRPNSCGELYPLLRRFRPMSNPPDKHGIAVKTPSIPLKSARRLQLRCLNAGGQRKNPVAS